MGEFFIAFFGGIFYLAYYLAHKVSKNAFEKENDKNTRLRKQIIEHGKERYGDLELENKLSAYLHKRGEKSSEYYNEFREVLREIGLASESPYTFFNFKCNDNFFNDTFIIILMAKRGKLKDLSILTGFMQPLFCTSDDMIQAYHKIMLWVSKQMRQYGLSEMQYSPYEHKYGYYNMVHAGYCPVSKVTEPTRAVYFFRELLPPNKLTLMK